MAAKKKYQDDELRICEIDEYDYVDNVKRILDDLFVVAKNFRSCSNFRELIDFISRFHHYSVFNAALVYTQMPGARFVLPAKRWLDEYKRIPIHGAQPLVMLQPMAPIMFGFDVSQTEGRPLPQEIESPFRVCGEINKEIYQRLLENCAQEGVLIRQINLGSTLGGYVRNANDPHHVVGIGLVRGYEIQKIYKRNKEIEVIAEITLNSNLPDETNFATLTHELGHLFCGHVGATNPPTWPGRKGLGIEQREFEAESVSFLVCRRMKLETPAADYLSGYMKEYSQIPEISFDVVLKSVQRIEAMCKPGYKAKNVQID